MHGQERDQTIERLLRQKLANAGPAKGPGACLDAEVIAAWADNGLSGAERSSAEAHVAACARCQALLAAMIRSTPAAATHDSRGAWWSPRGWIVWAAPAVAAVVAGALWFAIDSRSIDERVPAAVETKADKPAADADNKNMPVSPAPMEKEGRDQSKVAGVVTADDEAEKTRAVQKALGDRLARERSSESDRFADARLKAGNEGSKPAAKPVDALASKDRAGVAGGIPATRPPATEPPARTAEVAQVTAAPPAAPPPPSRPEQMQAQTQANQQIQGVANQPQSNVSPANAAQANAPPVNTAPVNQAKQAQNQTAQDRSTQTQTAASGQRQAAPAKPEPVVGALQESVVVRDAKRAEGRGGGAGAAAAPLEARMFRADAPPLEIPSPESAVRWRVVGQRAIARTTDGGTTWQAQTADVPLPLTAGSASSSTVCWLVGRAGLVLRTTDGGTWQRVRFPEAVDLTAVKATDEKSAVVTTSNGRTFATLDGGQTWNKK
jgi:hypothetical protein